MKIITIVLLTVIFVGGMSALGGGRAMADAAPDDTTAAPAPPKEIALTDAQITAAKAAIKALRHVKSRVDAGVTLDEYRGAVGDAGADIDDSLDDLPDLQIKVDITRAIQAYRDAGKWWSDARAFGLAKFLLEQDAERQMIEKYDLQIRKPGKYTMIYANELTRFDYETTPLMQIWRVADKSITWADEKVKAKKSP